MNTCSGTGGRGFVERPACEGSERLMNDERAVRAGPGRLGGRVARSSCGLSPGKSTRECCESHGCASPSSPGRGWLAEHYVGNQITVNVQAKKLCCSWASRKTAWGPAHIER